MNFNHLYYFYRVGLAGRITTAARELKVSQPALSSQLKLFESYLNVQLFRKKGRTLQLTQEGEAIFGIAQRMFDIADEIARVVNHGERGRTPLFFRVGITGDIERFFVISWMNTLFKQKIFNQKPRIRLSSEFEDSLMEKLEMGKIDIGFSSRPENIPHELHYSLISLKTIFVLGSSHEHAREFRKIKTRTEFVRALKSLKITWCLPNPGSQMRQKIDAFLDRVRIVPEILIESDVISVLTKGVISGLGGAFVPRLFVQEEIKSGNLITLPSHIDFSKHDIWMICSRNEKLKRYIPALHDDFQKLSLILTNGG